MSCGAEFGMFFGRYNRSVCSEMKRPVCFKFVLREVYFKMVNVHGRL